MKYIFVFVIIVFSENLICQYIWSDTIIGFGIKPEVAVYDDKIYVAYLSETNPGFVKCAEIKGGEIKIHNVATGYFYGPLDISINSQGEPAIAYHDHNTEDIGYAMFKEENWNIERIPNDGHDGWDGSVYFDSEDHAHIISIDPGNGVEYANNIQSEWLVETVDARLTNYKFATSIQGFENEIHLAYYISSDNALYFASKQNNEWSPELISDNAVFPSMIFDDEGYPLIGYYKRGEPGHIAVATKRNDRWTSDKVEVIDDIVESFNGARKLVELAKQDGIIHIAVSNKSIVRHGHFENGEWNLFNVYSAEDGETLGQQTSLAINNEGMPIVVIYERNREYEGGGRIRLLEAMRKDTSSMIGESSIVLSARSEVGDEIDDVIYEQRDSSNQTIDTITNDLPFRLSDLNENTSYICAKKSIGVGENLSAIDLVRMSRIVLEGTHTCPSDLIAADVNKTGNISALDIVQTLNVILGRSTSFSTDDSWRFYKKGLDISNSTLEEVYENGCISTEVASETLALDFIGVKLGDIKCNN